MCPYELLALGRQTVPEMGNLFFVKSCAKTICLNLVPSDLILYNDSIIKFLMCLLANCTRMGDLVSHLDLLAWYPDGTPS